MFVLFCLFFPASTGDEQHQFCPGSWVPTETVIVNRDREQRQLVNFEQLAQEFKREEDERKNTSVRLANCAGNER